VDLEAVFAKLVTRGRGGYCFEHNALFGAMLAAQGFANRALLGRVWLGIADGVMPPRTHTLRLVNLDGQAWIADAGFGGSYVPAMPLRDGAEALAPDGARHRLLRVGVIGDECGEWRLERQGSLAATDGRGSGEGLWQKQYSFDTGEVAQVDLEMSSHWTSTKPETRFTTACIASIVLEDGFASLNGRRLNVYSGGTSEERELHDADEWRGVVGEVFRIALSAQEVSDLRLF
jgi:N-hydroxyarylamine O-acetyltransferase